MEGTAAADDEDEVAFFVFDSAEVAFAVGVVEDGACAAEGDGCIGAGVGDFGFDFGAG